MLALSAIYFQDPGESVVLRHFTGTLSGISSESGAHIKSPFDACVRYDVRNNTVTFVGDGTEDQVHGGTAIGPQITFQDKEGVTGNLDVVVRYSIDPLAVKELYANYLSQENFVTKVVAQDVRSISRQIPGEYGTLALFNSRAEAEQAIFAALEKKWVNQPITLEAVNLQEIRYSEDIKQRYDDAQAARVAVDKAQAEQDAAEIQAETARIAAQGQADANAILTESLSEEILRQRYIDALQKGGAIYVVPEGSSPIVGVAPPVSAPAAPQPQ
ncbi:MAG: prohibitin family protein [Candidatus Nomurabacteria bacterium]|nr:prohibitin family protein [Candidatus Nomurabacteria bacterium]